ncbi:tyrosine/DOPA decarboxylase 2-like [Canna indica]|uniref:Tyrosine/DOPA decarboxylase 2-like n=1 Tax=Canna indica TaxID=4628 RepID=A0AAQ3JYE5_9LILI|nr:tyrosine/DOPA decarboxylase 2-like [Canna indica]
MLGAAFNVVGFNWIASPAATELEMIVMESMGKILCLPEHFLFKGGGGGVLQGTTCEALLSTLTAARDRALKEIGGDRIGDLVVYCSDQTHCSLKKAAHIAGIRQENIRALPTLRSDAFALSPNTLRAAVAGLAADIAAQLVPLYLCATVGTTPSGAVDPLRGLCTVAAEQGIWVHVDAAYAGSACICPEFRHFIDGVEGVDSFSLNAHKWFFTTLDCCCLWVKQPQHLVDALATTHEYLRNGPTEAKAVIDYKYWQITLSRRFRALKLWMVLRRYGVSNLMSFIRNHVRMAELFEGLVAEDERFEVVVPRTFAMVCLIPASTANWRWTGGGQSDERAAAGNGERDGEGLHDASGGGGDVHHPVRRRRADD